MEIMANSTFATCHSISIIAMAICIHLLQFLNVRDNVTVNLHAHLASTTTTTTTVDDAHKEGTIAKYFYSIPLTRDESKVP